MRENDEVRLGQTRYGDRRVGAWPVPAFFRAGRCKDLRIGHHPVVFGGTLRLHLLQISRPRTFSTEEYEHGFPLVAPVVGRFSEDV